MKRIFLTLTLILSTSLYAETCKEKITSIETKIEYAKKYNNKNQLRGLEIALAEAKSNCSDEKLRAARNAKVQDKEEDVKEAQAELKEAKNKLKSEKKIKDKQAKLNKKIKELEDLKSSNP